MPTEKIIIKNHQRGIITKYGAFVVTKTQNHRIIHLFNIAKILNKHKIFQDHQSENLVITWT